MSLQLKIDVKNNASKELIRLQKDLKQLNITIPKTSASFGALSASMAGFIASTYALNKAYGATIKRGLEYNNLIENQRNSIATLINVTSKNIDSQGKSLTYQEKMNLSLANSNELMAELTRINANTPQTLGQTAQIFKTMYAPMQKVGASQKDLIFLTEKLAIASKVGGVEFNSLLAGVDGLASGTVLANSDLGRFLSSLGLTNKALKESGDVVGLLKEKLKDFKAFDDLDTSISNLNVQWDTLTGNMTKDIYSAQKIYTKQLTGFLKKLNDEYKDYEQNIKRVADISKLKSTQDLSRELKQLKDKSEALKNITTFTKYLKYGSESAYKGEIKYNDFLIKQAEKRLKLLKEEKSLKVDSPKLVAKDAVKVDNTDYKALAKEQEQYEKDLMDEAEQSFVDMDNALKESLEYRNSLIMSDTSWQNYFIKTKDYEKAWLIESANIMQEHSALTESEMQKLLEITKVEFFDKVKDEMKDIEPFTFKVEVDTSSFSDMQNDILKVSKGFDTLSKEQKAYAKSTANMNKDSRKFKEYEAQHTQNQIQGYANLAGAMASSFKQGSKEAKAMIVVQTALSVATAMVAIANAGTGDPYTAIARVIAMIATLRSAGIALNSSSGGSDVVPKDYSSTIDSANYAQNINIDIADYDNNFDKFMEGLDKASERLEAFGSVGSSTSSEIDALLKAKIDSEKLIGLRAAFVKSIYGGSLPAHSVQTEKDWFGIDLTDGEGYIDKYEITTRDGYSSQSDFLTWVKDNQDIFTEIGAVWEDLSSTSELKKAGTALRSSTNELTTLLTEQVADSLDYGLLDKSQLENLLDGFDLSEYNKTLEQINDLAITAKQQGGTLTDEQQKQLIDLYTLPNFIQGQDYEGAIEKLQEFNDEILNMADSLDEAINTIRGNTYEGDTTASTNDLIDQYNKAIRLNDFETASNLAVDISNTAFGDTENLNKSLISSLEDAKLKIGIEDEVLNVNIVSSQLTDTSTSDTTYTPSVYVENTSTTSSSDDRLANIEFLLTQLLNKNTSIDNNIDGIVLNGIKSYAN